MSASWNNARNVTLPNTCLFKHGLSKLKTTHAHTRTSSKFKLTLKQLPTEPSKARPTVLYKHLTLDMTILVNNALTHYLKMHCIASRCECLHKSTEQWSTLWKSNPVDTSLGYSACSSSISSNLQKQQQNTHTHVYATYSTHTYFNTSQHWHTVHVYVHVDRDTLISSKSSGAWQGGNVYLNTREVVIPCILKDRLGLRIIGSAPWSARCGKAKQERFKQTNITTEFWHYYVQWHNVKYNSDQLLWLITAKY